MHCQTMAFISLLLELFGHIFITLNSLSAAWVYLLEPRLLSAMVHISQLSDVGGLVGGKLFGSIPFCNRLSPNKTCEGLIGGLLFTLLTVIGMWLIATNWEQNGYFMQMPLTDYIIFGFCCGLLAVAGDLLESFIKRCAGMKDSSHMLGSHGGVFDRYDSMMLPIPFILWYALYCG